MSLIFVGTTGDHAGHSIVTWALARRLVQTGLRVGFIKPFGTHPFRTKGILTDRDAHLLKEDLNLQEPLDRICPYPLSDEAWKQQEADEILKRIIALAQDSMMGRDILVVMGSRHIFFDDSTFVLSDIFLTHALKADFILVDRYRTTPKFVYSILSVYSLLQDRLKGIILNRVPPEEVEGLRINLLPSLTHKGIPMTTVLPEDPTLSRRTLGEVSKVIGGEILVGESDRAQPVGGMTVGSSDLKGELILFKRVFNKIILLKPLPPPGEAEDPAAARSIAGIVLTGGRNPAPQILAAARKSNTPLVIVKEDTFTVLERLENKIHPLSPGDQEKVLYFTDLMDLHGDLDRLLRSLGLIS